MDLPSPPSQDSSHEHRPHVRFLQLPWVQNLVPFVSSLAVHAGVLVLAAFFAKMVLDSVSPPKAHEIQQTVVAVMDAPNDTNLPGGVPDVGISNDAEVAMQTLKPEGAKPDGIADTEGANSISAPGAPGNTQADDVIGVGPGGILGTGISNGNGLGEGGPLRQFGLRNGGGSIGPHGPMFGPSGRANRIVFVCDATGSMLNKMPTLKQQLENAIQDLRPFQCFNIVFFYDGPKALACDPNGLIMATPANVKRACDFLDGVTATGQTDPFKALDIAFASNPQLVYLLSDGGLDDNLRKNPEILEKIGELERLHHNSVTINTIMFDEDSPSGRQLLTQISQEHRGTFRFVKEADLNR